MELYISLKRPFNRQRSQISLNLFRNVNRVRDGLESNLNQWQKCKYGRKMKRIISSSCQKWMQSWTKTATEARQANSSRQMWTVVDIRYEIFVNIWATFLSSIWSHWMWMNKLIFNKRTKTGLFFFAFVSSNCKQKERLGALWVNITSHTTCSVQSECT